MPIEHSVVRRLRSALLEVIAPGRCAFCAARADVMCDRCEALLPRLVRACGRCALPMPSGKLCGRCQQRPPAFDIAAAACHYRFPVDTAIKALKFRRQLFYVPAFVALLAPLLDHRFDGCDGLVPVPLHRWRQAARGFNQAAELARGLAATTGLPVSESLRRLRPTPPQSGLTAEQRRRNLRGAFAVAGAMRLRFPLIVDDVITTGHTCDELSRVLLAAGAERVGVVAVARAEEQVAPQAVPVTGVKV